MYTLGTLPTPNIPPPGAGVGTPQIKRSAPLFTEEQVDSLRKIIPPIAAGASFYLLRKKPIIAIPVAIGAFVASWIFVIFSGPRSATMI